MRLRVLSADMIGVDGYERLRTPLVVTYRGIIGGGPPEPAVVVGRNTDGDPVYVYSDASIFAFEIVSRENGEDLCDSEV